MFSVNLIVFLSGCVEVATIVNGEFPAGNYKILYDASKLPSGIYFYTLTANGFAETKK